MKLTLEDDVATLQMDFGKGNSMSAEMLSTLDARWAEIEASRARAVVLTGAERFFSGGLALPTLVTLDRPAMRAFIELFASVMMRVHRYPLPVVAAVNGHAIAGGCVLALQCDWRVIADGDLKIGLNEVQLGIGLPSIVVESLRAQVPPASVMPIALEGKLFSPQRALELGLVHEVAEPARLAARARERALELAQIPSSGYAQVKAALRRPGLETVVRDGAKETERWLDSWFSEAGRARIEATVARLTKRS
jgi:enoyl-CoA hydratase